jgi:hypothetical protein
MGDQLLLDGRTRVTGEIVGDQVEVAADLDATPFSYLH